MAVTGSIFALAGVGAASSAVSAAKGRTAARRAGQKQEAGIQNALNVQDEQLGIARNDLTGASDRAISGLEPFRDLGANAISPLENLLGPGVDISEFLKSTPGYQASLEGGTQAIDAAASNAGLLGSGARAKELSRFGSDLATQTLGQERNALFEAIRLGSGQASNIANIETGTAANLVNRGSAFATQTSNLMTDKGNVKAKTILDRNSAFQTGLEGVTQAATTAIGSFG